MRFLFSLLSRFANNRSSRAHTAHRYDGFPRMPIHWLCALALLLVGLQGARSAHAQVPLAAPAQEVIDFVSPYDGTRIVGVWATPALQSDGLGGTVPVPAAILMHGYTGPFRSSASPLDPESCELRLDEDEREDLVLKSYYQEMADFLVARGVAVFVPDSFSGRCLEDFLGRSPPDDTSAHAAHRAGDAYASLQHLVGAYSYVDRNAVAAIGLWHGGAAALLAVADVERMDRAPFAASGYPSPGAGYVAPPSSTGDWRFAAAVSINPGTAMYGYLGDSSIEIADEQAQAEGLYGSYAPTLLLCGRDYGSCYEPNSASEYGKFDSLVVKAQYTTPEVAFDSQVFDDADGGFMASSNDDDATGNAAARAQTYAAFESWLLPRIQPAMVPESQLARVSLPAGRHIVSFTSGYDGIDILGALFVPEGEALVVEGRGTRAAVVLLHGSGGMFRDSPLAFHDGPANLLQPGTCAPAIPSSAYDELEVKLSYQEMVEFFLDRGVIVFLPDSFTGRCLEEFRGMQPPNDVYAHPFQRAHDAVEALRYLREDSPVAGLIGRAGVAGYSHGGSSALLAVADLDSMTEAPYAPSAYTDPSYGYGPPPGPVAGLEFTLGVNFYGGVGLYGYLGTNSVSRDDIDEAFGLYGSYAPLFMFGGDQDSIYYEEDDEDDDEYGKFSSFLLKAALTRPDMPVEAQVYAGAEHQILNPYEDDDAPGNADARALIYRSLASRVIPMLQFLP